MDARTPKESPKVFTASDVRTILADRKTQFRLAMKVQPFDGCGQIQCGPYNPVVTDGNGEEQPGPEIFGAYDDAGEWGLRFPFGQPGDHIWVREAWRPGIVTPAVFAAAADEEDDGPWKPAIAMPRAVARILLEIVSVRVQRLQDITEAEARAEGIIDGGCLNCGNSEPCGCASPAPDARDAFIRRWNSTNGANSWISNPWVWAVEFKRIDVESAAAAV